MRLHKHDELVESLQKRIKYELGIISDDAAHDLAAATIDALLDAAVKLGVGGPGITVIDNVNCKFVRDPVSYETPDTLILRLEASDDK